MQTTAEPLGERRVMTRGRVTVEYYDHGTGPVVILLPALANSVWEFNALTERLNAAAFRTLAVQFPGIGASWRPFRPRIRLNDLADDLIDVLRHAGVPETERVHLVGRALGNRVARAFASRFPHRTAKVVLLAAGGKDSGVPSRAVMFRYLLLQIPGLPVSMRRRLLEANSCARRNVLPVEACRKPPFRAMVRQGGAARRTDSREWWDGGRAPLLVIQGEQDRIAKPDDARALQQAHPDRVQLEMIPEAGHSLLFEQPERVIARILAFLSADPH